jgi:hypothetical protein
MPPALRTASTAPDVLSAVEGVSVKVSGRSIALPGVRAGRSLNLAVGSVVLTPTRVLASVGPWVILHTDLAEDPRGGHTVTLTADGMHLHIDVPEIYAGGRGTFDLYFRTPLDQSVLAQVPSTPRSVSLPDGIAPLVRRWA